MKKLFDKCKRYGKKYSVALMDIVMSYVLWLFWMKFFPISTITPDSGVPLSIVGLVFSFLVVACLIFSGVYMTLWRYVSVSDLTKMMLFSFMANGISALAINVIFYRVSYWFLLMQLFVFTMGFLATRMLYYVYCKRVKKTPETPSGRNVLIIGAGDACRLLLNELAYNNVYGYNPVGIIDDDRNKYKGKLMGVPVIGDRSMIEQRVTELNVHTIIFAIVNIDTQTKGEILQRCTKICDDVKIVQRFYDDYDNTKVKIRKVTMEELLGREVIDIKSIRSLEYLRDKVVMVTGGGGSIGTELCLQICECTPKKLIILDNYENNAYEVQQMLLARKYPFPICVEIANIREADKLEYLYKKYSFEIIFHAAAHKHVPLMETNPEEAVKNNVIGTYNLLYLAEKYKVSRFVTISTDKAVNPTNVMGATKRVTEKMMLAFSQHENQTIYSAVRFGNVLGSNGSVIPLFQKQLEAGGPLTVTHPEATRFFMTVSEAVSLVLTAGSISAGGEIFVLNMGKPVKIREMAESFIRLNGKEPYTEIAIDFIGLRPGEKLYEELLIDNDALEKTSNEKIYIEPRETVDEKALYEKVDKLAAAAKLPDSDEVVELLKQIVPEFDHRLNK